MRFVFALSYIAAVGVLRTPTIERPRISLYLCFFVSPVKPLTPFPLLPLVLKRVFVSFVVDVT
jgi:hypothetical protein